MKLWHVAVLIVIAFIATGCTREPEGTPLERDIPGSDAGRGRELIAGYGCGSCHTIDGVPGANAKVGPPLTDFRLRHAIAGTLPNTPDNLIHWITDPQGVRPGTDMPNLGVSPDEARDIAAYLYHQSSTWELRSLAGGRGD